ncbi:hypothetical protein THAOC_22449 [Thalassiosira oceanica]|uniref:Peptidase S9 prolyl oligopeptidase catalytic domain-containing protein n=1 Tax=Thalassiosira oceanica TaxID=159749 RepID=K0RWZ6_THAOC|nr:hypothetical protein THAOC_22449 [Thalassiosira oceanica]|eukprot:EJK57500.1 hypothetical protein THAOC_22449 [Thalassiosira oceanica]
MGPPCSQSSGRYRHLPRDEELAAQRQRHGLRHARLTRRRAGGGHPEVAALRGAPVPVEVVRVAANAPGAAGAARGDDDRAGRNPSLGGPRPAVRPAAAVVGPVLRSRQDVHGPEPGRRRTSGRASPKGERRRPPEARRHGGGRARGTGTDRLGGSAGDDGRTARSPDDASARVGSYSARVTQEKVHRRRPGSGPWTSCRDRSTGPTTAAAGRTAGRGPPSEGFRLDQKRRTVVVTARRTGGAGGVCYSDDLYRLRLGESGALLGAAEPLGSDAVSGKGCKIPVAVGEDSVVYHHRSPTESGDLWVSAPGTPAGEARVTETMPLSLRRKLLVPREVTIANGDAPARPGKAPLPVHAQVFVPGGDGPLQPLLWLHGGPMAQYSFDCNTLLSWLAGCGYLVLAPNFSGSTGSGLEFMDRVLGEGCGVADLSDCLACAAYLESGEAAEMESRLDLSRGVAVGGHSWGGYLAYMCMLEKRPDGTSVFGCGVAAAGIADWFVQQRHTEVRYYDHALMGGWVYEGEVSLRARRASPMSRAADLRAPILVLHGEEDVDVPFRQIPPLVEAMRRSPHPGASVKYHAYKGEDHGMSGTEAQADYLDRVKTFLRINLKPWDFTDNPHGEVTAY